MNQYIITEDGFNELDAYFFEQKDPGVTTVWINLKNKEFQRCNAQAERDKVLDKLTERIKRFEEHQVFCITRNQIWTCDKIRGFIAELRTPAPETGELE